MAIPGQGESAASVAIVLLGRRRAFAFDHAQDLICFDVFNLLDQSAGPMNLQTGFLGCAQAEVESQIALRKVTAATAHFVHSAAPIRGGAVDARADRGAV